MEEINVTIKPIMINEIKTEIEVKISPDRTVNELIKIINDIYGSIGTNLNFLFRGKKLNHSLSLKSQNVLKSGLILLMQRSKEKVEEVPKVSNEEELNKAKEVLNKKYPSKEKQDMIASLLKTLPNITQLTSDAIIDKVITFITTVSPDPITPTSMKFSQSSYKISEPYLTSIFAMGNGLHGQLGINSYIKTASPIRVNPIRNIKVTSISCGTNHTVALTSSNTVYAWGRFFKPLSKDSTVSTVGDYPKPILMESIVNDCIVKISCGGNHSMAINDKGELYTWGEGIHGQLGHGILNNELYPRKIELKPQIRIVDVKGGAMHTMALTDKGFILGWGSNERQQLLLQKVKMIKEPVLVPLYEFNNIMTVDEIRFNAENEGEVNQMNVINSNDLTSNIEDIMKVKLISCGMWYTAVTSQLFPLDIYIIGNNNKKSIKITYFEKAKHDMIKQIEATTDYLYVLLESGSLYKVKIDALISDKSISSGNEAVIVDNTYSNMNIDKIACGYDYILSLTKSNMCYYTSVKENKTELLNSDIKTDIYDIASGNDFCFLITRLNIKDFSDILYERIENNEESSTCDITLLSDTNNEFKCHSFIIEQYIALNKLIKNDKGYITRLNDEDIKFFLKLIYTGNIDWIMNDLDEKVEKRLNSISQFITENGNDKEECKILKELIKVYKDKSEIGKGASEIYSKEDIDSVYTAMISKTYRLVVMSEANITMNNNIDIIRRSSQENIKMEEVNNEEEENEEEEPEQPKSAFDTSNKGVVVNSEGKNISSGLNLESYKKYKEYIEHSFMIYKTIEKLKQSLSEHKLSYIKSNISPQYKFILQFSPSSQQYIINKELISIKSILFSNYISSSDSSFDFTKANVNAKSSDFDSIVKFIMDGAIEIQSKDILDLLDLSIYFMIDNLTSCIEILLEEIIDFDNVLCLIEISKDYDLTFLYRACIIFLMIHLTEIKSKGMIKHLQAEDKEQLKQFLLINNKSL